MLRFTPMNIAPQRVEIIHTLSKIVGQSITMLNIVTGTVVGLKESQSISVKISIFAFTKVYD